MSVPLDGREYHEGALVVAEASEGGDGVAGEALGGEGDPSLVFGSVPETFPMALWLRRRSYDLAG
jgi:hypothetical protein